MGMIIGVYILFLTNTFFTVWLNTKFIKDSNGKDQYWHHVQFYQQIAIYLSLAAIVYLSGGDLVAFIPRLISYALMYMFVYNSGLNAMRRLNITHIGRYDVPYWITLVLFIIGFSLMIFTIFPEVGY